MLLLLARFGNEGRRPGLLVSGLKCLRVSKFFARYDALAARKCQARECIWEVGFMICVMFVGAARMLSTAYRTHVMPV